MISIIVAISDNNCIGRNGEIPWYLPDDLARFKKITSGHTVVMGRKTYQSIIKRLGHPLPNRENIVLTENRSFKTPGCFTAFDTSFVLQRSKDGAQIFVIGGTEIYRIFLPSAEKMYITRVHTVIPDGDAFFPEWNPPEWELQFEPMNSVMVGHYGTLVYEYTDYQRRRKHGPFAPHG